MIVLNILGWILVIILGIIFLPIFIGLLYWLGYILFWNAMVIAAVMYVYTNLLFDKIKSIFIKN